MKIGEIILGIEGENLVKLYSEKLGITIDEACEIFKQNKTALALLKEELALTFTGTDTNLSALMRATILRKFYDFEKLRPSEVDLIYRHYGINIKKKTGNVENKAPNFGQLISAIHKPVANTRFKIDSSAKVRFVQEDEIAGAVAIVPEKISADESSKRVKRSGVSRRDRAAKRAAKKTRAVAVKKTH